MRSAEILLTIKLKQQLFADPKRIRLLKEIEKCGSINQAAKNAKVSYKSAWDHLEAMNKISPKPLLERNIGGKNGGGTALTVYAQRLLQLYDLLEQTQEKAFSILKDEKVPLNSLLSATARFSLQSSARNQFFGIVQALRFEDVHCFVDIELEGFSEPLTVSITEKSAVRLKLELNKEVMLMFKAPWVKIRAKQARNMPNQFRATVKSIIDKGEAGEAILVLEDSKIEFCATLTKTQHIELEQQVWISVDPEQIILATLY
ncbi:TOBE domain-containing protein [Aggregatibacter actinomycetemcomitans]|uniref:TOBE domain-containing protein n=1 Tax=Aggregatibacter actinomycetemcomitans TaxID=714 RepID=UPI00022AC0E0|nr:TOBE domain-containing protein [Aggregatibacter actinomycetemcomitans]KND82812.1 transcriptional regulator [Aggregatibacter actinomycetemcomitans serotype b str. SCC1398]KOE53223.1 transcriptional regulator [Aggregatibacter actinomycetemcomitans serotype b str. SCC4092]